MLHVIKTRDESNSHRFYKFWYGSSCNYLFFGLILAHLLSLSIHWHPQSSMGCHEKDRKNKEAKMRTKRENYMKHAVQKNGKSVTNRLASATSSYNFDDCV